MAHADYTMTGPCEICRREMFVGVCPHGKAIRKDLAPEAIAELRKKLVTLLEASAAVAGEVEALLKKYPNLSQGEGTSCST